MDWSGVITCGLLWCFYQLFGLSFWRHPFTAEDPLVSKWCNAEFLQLFSAVETHLHLGWPEGEYIFSKFSLLWDLSLYNIHASITCQQHSFPDVEKHMWRISGCLQELEVIFIGHWCTKHESGAVLCVRQPTSEFTGVPATESTSENGSN